MSFIDEYNKVVKTPTIEVTITKYPTGVKPSVDTTWYGSAYDYTPEVISCDLSFGHDQISASCTLVITSDEIFEPMNKVIVKQGWNGENIITFFGWVDKVNLSDFPRTQTLECRDILKLAQNNYYLHTDCKGYYFEPFPYSSDEPEFMLAQGSGLEGEQTEEERYADVIIKDFLEKSGIPASRQNLSEINYYIDSTPIHLVIGNHKQWLVEYTSAADAINEICELTGYRLWATPDGMVQLTMKRPFAAESAAYSYQRGVLGEGAIIKLNCESSDENLRNWIYVKGLKYLAEEEDVSVDLNTGWNWLKYNGVDIVPSGLFVVTHLDPTGSFERVWVERPVGEPSPNWLMYDPDDLSGSDLDIIYEGEYIGIVTNAPATFTYTPDSDYIQIASLAFAESDYISDPPRYRRAEVISELIDIPEMAQWIANTILDDLNRIAYTGRATIEGDPRLHIGMTLNFYDEYVTGIGGASSINFFLYDYSSHQDAGSYTMDLTLVGGEGAGAPPATVQNPISSFYPVITVSGSSTIIFVDGTASYDPDGTISSYLWVCSGYASKTTVTNTYTYAGLNGSITVNLTVTDDDALSDTMTQIISFNSTNIIPPTVVTNAATGVTDEVATLNGNLTNWGSAVSGFVSFLWATDAYYTGHGSTYDQETTPQAKIGTGLFSKEVTSLASYTTYHFMAKAYGSGISYGLDSTFETEEYVPTPPSENQRQLIVGGYYGSVSSTGTRYNTLGGGCAWSTSEFYRGQVISASGILSNLEIEMSASPGVDKKYTFTLMKNGVAQDLEAVVEDSSILGSDTSSEVLVNRGDWISLRCVPYNTPSIATAWWSSIFTPFNSKESLILGRGITNKSSTQYVPLMQSYGESSASEAEVYQVLPTSGVIKNLYVILDTDPGTSPDSYKFTLRKNETSTALTCTIQADNTTGNDITHIVSGVLGDRVSVMVEPLNSPSVDCTFNFGMTFVSTTLGESILLGGSSDLPTIGVAEYSTPVTTFYYQPWSSYIDQRYMGMQEDFVLTKLCAHLSNVATAPIQLGVYTWGTPPSIVITAGQQSGSDIYNHTDLVQYGQFSVWCIASGTSRHIHYGMVLCDEDYFVPIIPPEEEEEEEPPSASGTVASGFVVTIDDGCTSNVSVQHPFQRAVCCASGIRWAFYSDGTNLVYKSSINGVDWSGKYTVRPCTDADHFSIFYGDNRIHYVYARQTPASQLYYRSGYPNANRTITDRVSSIPWSGGILTGEQVAAASGANLIYGEIGVCCDANGYPWASTEYWGDPGSEIIRPAITKSSTDDGTWSTAPGYILPLANFNNTTKIFGTTVVPLASGVLEVWASYNNDKMGMRFYNGATWLPSVSGISNVYNWPNFSAVGDTDSSVAHIAFKTGNTLKHVVFSGATNKLSGENLISASGNNVSLSKVGDDLYAFWDMTNQIWYNRYTSNAWGTPVMFQDETTDTIKSSPMSAYEASAAVSGVLGVLYLTEAISPYKVRHISFFPGGGTVAEEEEEEPPVEPPPASGITISIVDSSVTTSSPTASPFQRKTFYAVGRYWVFYSDGGNLCYKSSTDNVTWTTKQTVRWITRGFQFSVCFDGTYVRYACFNGGSINKHCRGTPNGTTGLISWSAEDTIYEDGYYRTEPGIITNTDGYPWLSWEMYEGSIPDYNGYATKSTTISGFTTASGFPYAFCTQVSTHSSCIVAMTSNKVLAASGETGNKVDLRKWDSTWAAIVSSTSSLGVTDYKGWSMASYGDTVHLAINTGSAIKHQKYTASTNTLSSETTILSSSKMPTLAVDDSGNVYCFWNDGVYIYYKIYNGSSWGSINELVVESVAIVDTNTTAFQHETSGRIGVVYAIGYSSPYTVKFASMAV